MSGRAHCDRIGSTLKSIDKRPISALPRAAPRFNYILIVYSILRRTRRDAVHHTAINYNGALGKLRVNLRSQAVNSGINIKSSRSREKKGCRGRRVPKLPEFLGKPSASLAIRSEID